MHLPNWNQILDLIQQEQAKRSLEASLSSDTIRRGYLSSLQGKLGRNVVAYYSGFLSKPGVAGTDINDEDVNGFMATAHMLDRSLGLTLLLHTPGGGISAATSIVHYLRGMYSDNIEVIVPQIAMSAGTMIACASKKIWMSKHSQLGPTDPHLNGIPAAGVKDEFLRACREVKKDPSRIPVWQAIIGKYSPTFLSRCENAVVLSKAFVQTQLAEVMFAGEPNANSKARSIVSKLTNYKDNRSHSRPLFIEECKKMGLKIGVLEADQEVQDLVLSIHHCYMHGFMNGAALKIIENHIGTAIVKQQTHPAVAR